MSKLQFFLRAFLAAAVGATVPTIYWVLDVLGIFGADYVYDGIDLPLQVGAFLAFPVCFVGALFAAGLLKHSDYGRRYDRWYAGLLMGGLIGALILGLLDFDMWPMGAAYGASTGLAVWLLFRRPFALARSKEV